MRAYASNHGEASGAKYARGKRAVHTRNIVERKHKKAARKEAAVDAWGFCVWCDKPSTTTDRRCSAPDGDGHLFKPA